MSKVLIYTGPSCPYCVAAKTLLKNKNVSFEEINLGEQPDKMNEMLQKSGGRRTVPQIFIGETHVGGSDELHALEKAGKLNSLLNI
ncbi:MAG: glutaredoxin 3 [Pelagibacteraceae bacterium]|jgi:glutaredoxin 3